MRESFRRMAVLPALVGMAIALAACEGGSGADRGGATDLSAAADVLPDVPEGDADATGGRDADVPVEGVRKVAVSLPYGPDAEASTAWMLLDLSIDGVLAASGPVFQMGRAFGGRVAFTPDGTVGIAPQDDGTLGVFRIQPDGTPVVVHAAFDGGCYAAVVVMAPAGDHAFVLDSQWRENGGGVYRVDIAIDGTLTARGRIVEARLPRAMLPLPGRPDRMLLAADDALDSPAGRDAQLLQWGDSPSVVGGIDVFPDEAMVAGAAVTPDGKYVLLGDNDEYSGVPNRVAVVEVQGDQLSVPQTITPLQDPLVLLAAPAGGVVLAVSGYGNALIILDRDDDAAGGPFASRGEVEYKDGVRPQLPGAAVLIERGALSGLVLVSEVTGIRTVRMKDDGAVEDLGVTSLGDSFTGMPGALGVQP